MRKSFLAAILFSVAVFAISCSQQTQYGTNGVVGEISVPAKQKKMWYRDYDLDGYGSNTVTKFRKDQPAGYIERNGDCKDSVFTINPSITEIWDGIDNNCNDLIDEGLISSLNLTTSTYQINPLLSCISGNDIQFNKGDQSKNIVIDPYLSVVRSGNFKALEYGTGATSDWYHIVNQETMTKINGGNGYNPSQPPNCEALQGVLCKSFRLGTPAINYDFYMAQDSLCSLLGANNIIISNSVQGTVDETYIQIDRLIARKMSPIVLQFGAEEVTKSQLYWGGSGANYAIKFNDWQKAIKAKYPKQKFKFIVDAAPANGGKKDQTWNAQVIAALTPDTTEVRAYYHLFQLTEWNGTITHDTAEVTKAINVKCPALTSSWINSVYKGKQIYVGQYSALADSAYSPGAQKGKQYISNFIPRFQKYVIEYNRDNGELFFGASIVALNGFINAFNVPTLDFHYLSVANNLYNQPLKALYASAIAPQVDIYGGSVNGKYCVIILNYSGKDQNLPVNINLDGNHTTWRATKTIGKYCDKVDAITCVDYLPTTTIKGFSINYFEIEAPSAIPN